MASNIPMVKPIIGNWYQDPIEGLYFEVVAVDSDSGDIEVQYSGGEVGEIDRESWSLLYLSPAAPPEDANAAFGFSGAEDWNADYASGSGNWNNPLDEIEPDLFSGSDDY